MVEKSPGCSYHPGQFSFLGEQYLTFTYYNAISDIIFQYLNDLDVQEQENLCFLHCLAGGREKFRQE